MHRWEQWPHEPECVTWQSNASLVIASYSRALEWVGALPAGLLDLVVYRKVDFGLDDGGSALSRARSLRRLPGLAYLALVPNFGRVPSEPTSPTCAAVVWGMGGDLPSCSRRGGVRADSDTVRAPDPRGGSREAFPFLTFLLEFRHRLPPVVIFSQDDCGSDHGCGWRREPQRLAALLADWRRTWGGRRAPPAQANCLCKHIEERTYNEMTYHFYRFTSLLQERLLGADLRRIGWTFRWPAGASFAFGGHLADAQPRWLFEALLRLTSIEGLCFGAGSIWWAFALERLWFQLLDPRALPRRPPGADEPTPRWKSECAQALRPVVA